MAKSRLTPELLEDICTQIAEGKSLRRICREMDLRESLVRYWLSKDEAAFAHSTRARERAKARRPMAKLDINGKAFDMVAHLVRSRALEIFANRVDRGCAIANAAVELRETEHPGRQGPVLVMALL